MKLYLLKRERFPLKLTLYSRDGVELWTTTIMDPGDSLTSVKVPGFGGTEHVPVRAVVSCADGETFESVLPS